MFGTLGFGSQIPLLRTGVGSQNPRIQTLRYKGKLLEIRVSRVYGFGGLGSAVLDSGFMGFRS